MGKDKKVDKRIKKCCNNCKRLENWDFQKGITENKKFHREILEIKGCGYTGYIVVHPERSKCRHLKKEIEGDKY